jgi:hypothetical protein
MMTDDLLPTAACAIVLPYRSRATSMAIRRHNEIFELLDMDMWQAARHA